MPPTMQGNIGTKPLSVPPSSNETEADLLALLDSPEAQEDEKAWDAMFAATSADKVRRLADKVRADMKAGKVRPLNSNDL